MTEAPERIWRSPAHSRFASENHGIASWMKKDFAESGAQEYIRADIHDALVKAADELAESGDDAIQNADRLGDYSDPMVSLSLSVLKDLNAALTAYRKARGETQ